MTQDIVEYQVEGSILSPVVNRLSNLNAKGERLYELLMAEFGYRGRRNKSEYDRHKTQFRNLPEYKSFWVMEEKEYLSLIKRLPLFKILIKAIRISVLHLTNPFGNSYYSLAMEFNNGIEPALKEGRTMYPKFQREQGERRITLYGDIIKFLRKTKRVAIITAGGVVLFFVVTKAIPIIVKVTAKRKMLEKSSKMLSS